jgi:hypothetical protein
MKPIYRGMTKKQLDKASYATGVTLAFAVSGILMVAGLLILLGESLHASKLACEQISLIRQYCAESGLLGESGGNKRPKISVGENDDGLTLTTDAPNQSHSVELTDRSAGDLEKCIYCDMRNAMPFTRGDYLDALCDAFFSPGDPAGAQLVRCGHNPDRKDECRADRGGVHWQAAVSAFNLRRDIEASRKSHKKTESKQENSEENPEFMIREDKF